MQEAISKVAEKRTDYSVGVEGESNKAFQAQPLIHFGGIENTMHRKRGKSTNIGPTETKQSYAFTSEKRKKHQQEVYSVNIPFSKYPGQSANKLTKPGSAQGKNSQEAMMSMTGGSGAALQTYSGGNSVTGGFGHDANNKSQLSNKETLMARKANQEVLMTSSVSMKFPESSPYNSGKITEFKPNQTRKEMILAAKKAEFQGQLIDSSIKFSMDERNNRVAYNNNAGGGGEKDLIYNVKANKQEMTWVENNDKGNKNHLTQMQTLNSMNGKGTRSDSLQPTQAGGRFQTITDSYYRDSHKSVQCPKDVEQLRNHYKFHKGTTYSIGHEKNRPASLSLAQESFVAKHRLESGEVLPGRRNQQQLGIKNQNLIKNYAIGDDTPAVRGSDDVGKVKNRSHSTYNSTLQGSFTK